VDAVVKGLAALLFCAAVALACWGIVADSTPTEQHAQEVSTEQGTKLLTLDTSNAAQMHRYCMPTKADCMQWHVHGQWGWIKGGKLYAFDELPGDSRAWDELYGIDSDNKAFDK
jgi:hypothetical protein